LGLPDPGSAIVSLAVGRSAQDSLAAAGVVASIRNGRLRLSFHVCNDDRDVDVVVRALGGGHVVAERPGGATSMDRGLGDRYPQGGKS
jgi:hypothetical protein